MRDKMKERIKELFVNLQECTDVDTVIEQIVNIVYGVLEEENNGLCK